jgi:O-antigen/teichoic acid export membrane protein
MKREPETPAGDGGRHYRRMFRHGATYGLGSLANRLAGFVLLPLYTRVIPPDELGILWVMVATGGFLGAVLNMGMSSAIFRFYFDSTDEDHRRRVVTSAFAAVTVVSIVVLLGLWTLREPLARLLTGSSANAHFVDVTLASVLFDVALFVPLGVLRAQERSLRFTAIAVARFLVSVTLSIWLVVGREMGAFGVIVAMALTNAAIFVLVSGEILSRVRAGVSRTLVRGLSRFGLPIMLATIGSFLVDSSDLWLLRAFRGLEEVSLYGTAYRIAKILQVLIIQPFILAWPAVMWSVAKRPESHAVYARTLTFAVATIACAALGVSLFRVELISIISTEEFLPAAWVMPWIVYGFTLLLSTYVLNTGISLSGRTEFMAWTMAITVLVNVGLNLLVIPAFGMRGAAISTFVAYAVMAVGMTVFSQRLHPIAYDWRRLVRLAVVAAALTFLGLSLEGVGGAPGIVLRMLVWLAFPAFVVSPMFMTAREREGARDAIARLRRRGGA